MPDLKQLADLVESGRCNEVEAYTRGLLSEGVSPETIVAEGFMPGMYEVGMKFDRQQCFITDMLMAARAMKLGYAVIQDWLGTALPVCKYKVVIGTVQGDLHDIGKNLVKIMMEGSGLEVIDLGVDVSPETFVSTAKEQNCQIIACSSLLTTCMGEMRGVVSLARSEGIRDKVKILVGGAPITQSFCEEIGADAYTDDAAQAARKALELLGA